MHAFCQGREGEIIHPKFLFYEVENSKRIRPKKKKTSRDERAPVTARLVVIGNDFLLSSLLDYQ